MGNVGSGKTACQVRELILNKSRRKTYSNIITDKIPNNVLINPGMIIKKELIKTVKKRDGSTEKVFKLSLNKEYWQSIKEPINVVIDEAHTMLNPRKSSSKCNIILTEFISLARRILGDSSTGYGELIFITQLQRRIDIIAREMCTQVRYHICHFTKTCKCGTMWTENSEMPEGLWECPSCGGIKITKQNFRIEVWHFPSMTDYEAWKLWGNKTFYKHYFINDIEKYFPFYDTQQWDNLFSEYY